MRSKLYFLASALLLWMAPAFCQSYDYVQSFSLSGAIVGNSSQIATGTIVVNRAADGGSGPVYVGVGAPSTLDCQYGPAGDGCLIPDGAYSTTVTLAYPFTVAATTTYTVHTHVDSTPDAGIDQTLTVNPASYSMSVSPASVMGGSSTEPVLTVNRTPPPLDQEPFSVTITSGSGTDPGTVEIQPSGSAQASISNSYTYATADVVTFCGTISGGSSCAANTTLTFTPLNVTLTLAPGGVVGETSNGTIEGTGQGMISIAGPLSTQVTISFSGASPPISSTPSFGDIYIPAGSTSASFQFWGNYVTSVTSGTLTAYLGTANGNSSSSAPVTVYPAPASAPMGSCPKPCDSGGSPINFTDGNVWIQERDYSLPGLGGGLDQEPGTACGAQRR